MATDSGPEKQPTSSTADSSEEELKQREAEALLKMMDQRIAEKRMERRSRIKTRGRGTLRIAAILLLVVILLVAWLMLSSVSNLTSVEGLKPKSQPAPALTR